MSSNNDKRDYEIIHNYNDNLNGNINNNLGYDIEKYHRYDVANKTSYGFDLDRYCFYDISELKENSTLMTGENRENRVEISKLNNSQKKNCKIKDMFSYIFSNIYKNQGPDSAITKL